MTSKEIAATRYTIKKYVDTHNDLGQIVSGMNIIAILLILERILAFINKEFVKDGVVIKPNLFTKVWKGAKAIAFLFGIAGDIKKAI